MEYEFFNKKKIKSYHCLRLSEVLQTMPDFTDFTIYHESQSDLYAIQANIVFILSLKPPKKSHQNYKYIPILEIFLRNSNKAC